MLDLRKALSHALASFARRDLRSAQRILRASGVSRVRQLRDVNRLTVEATVSLASRRYEVVVILTDEPVATCSCALGSDCVHIAAVLEHLRDDSAFRPLQPTTAKKPPRARAKPRARETRPRAKGRLAQAAPLAVSADPTTATAEATPTNATSVGATTPSAGTTATATSDATPANATSDATPANATSDATPANATAPSPESLRETEGLALPSRNGELHPAASATPVKAAPLSNEVAGWLDEIDELDEDSADFDDHLPIYVLFRAGDAHLTLGIEARARVVAHHGGSRASAPRTAVPISTLPHLAFLRGPNRSAIDSEIASQLRPWVEYRNAQVLSFGTATDMTARLLELLVRSKRVVVVASDGTRRPLLRGPTLRGALGFQTDPIGRQHPVVRAAEASSGSAWMPLGVPPSDYLDFDVARFGSLETDASAALVEAWLAGPPVAPGEAAAVKEYLVRRGLPAPKDVVVRAQPIPLRARLVSTPLVSGTPASPRVEPYFEIEGAKVPTWAMKSFVVEREDALELIEPDLSSLSDFAERLTAAGFSRRMSPSGSKLSHMVLTSGTPYDLEPLAREALADGPCDLEIADDYAFTSRTIAQAELSLDDADGGYRAGLVIDVHGEKVDVLPIVLRALAGEKTFPRHGLTFQVAGKVFRLPVARIEGIRDLLVELAERGEGAVIPRARALAVPPGFLPREPESLARLREELVSPRPVTLPPDLEATLRPYQLEGFRWLMSRMRAGLGAVLADDMGLGKTVQAIALLLASRVEGESAPGLVVSPKSVAPNWADELRRFAPSLRVLEHHGKERERADEGANVSFDEADIVLTTYPILVMDEAHFAKASFSVVVLDEAQAIKNPRSTTAHAASALRATFKVALTGTPFENNLLELWSLFHFTLPELLGEEKTFGKLFRRPIETHGDAEAREALRRRIFPFLLRRTKEVVAKDLPEKTVTVSRVELSPNQRDVYETVRATMSARVAEALATKGLKKAHILILDALLKLRQAACDPRLLRMNAAKRAPSAKLEHLGDMLAELVSEGRRVLVFSQFVTMLDNIAHELDSRKLRYTVLTGQTENRRDVVRGFQEGDAPIFLLSLKAGGTGLNLTAADVVIHYDPWWNPAAESQATDRAHRVGQDKPVFVYKLIGKETIEEKILALQERKRDLFASVLEDGSDVASRLTEDDVRFLFS